MTLVASPVRCLRCGRALSATASVRTGYGPGCRARIRAAAVADALRDFTAAQVDKARELIADGAIVPTGFARVGAQSAATERAIT